MITLPREIASLLWYLQRPKLYRDLARAIAKRLPSSEHPLEHTRAQSENWCRERAVSPSDALAALGFAGDLRPLGAIHSNVLALAKQTETACPVNMGGGGDLDLLYWLAEFTSAKVIVETGVAYGWSSLAFLLSLRNRPESQLFSTDRPYPRRENDEYVGCVVPKEFHAQWTIIRNADREALPQILRRVGRSVDLCHYDSDKSYTGRMWSYSRLWPALRPGGILVSDDIGDNVAFKEFADLAQVRPLVIASAAKFVGVLKKSD